VKFADVLRWVASIPRWLSAEAWLILAALVMLTAIAGYSFHKGVQEERDRQTAKNAKIEGQASTGREKAAVERSVDQTSVADRLEKRNQDAQTLPDGTPDAREFRYRCGQLRDAGVRVPECG